MKKYLLSLAAVGMLGMPTVAVAQDGDDEWAEDPVFPTIESGYFRFVNNGYGDVLSLDGKHALSLSQTESTASTMPGTIFYYDTNGIYSFADDMAQLGDNLTVADLMFLMATASWKSGSYTTYDLASQGISLGGYLRKLETYVNAALDDFAQSDAVKNFYENGPAWYLSVAMSGAFYPADMESLDTFRAAVARYMKRWKSYFDYNIYLKPAQNVEHGFLLHFHAPLDISKVKDTQEQINNMSDPDTGERYGYNYDFFGAFKRLVVEEAAKELDAEGVAYIERVLAPLELDYEYYIGENEQGQLYVQGLSREAMFGENGELANINQDELLWTVLPVDEQNPLLAPMSKQLLDQDGYYYTTTYTDFAYQLGEGVEACYVDAVNDGRAHLVPISGRVPANTAVILRSKSAAAVSNVLLPVNEEVAPIAGNLLKGTCLPMDDAQGKSLLAPDAAKGIIAFKAGAAAVPANACYIDTPADGAAVSVATLDANVAAGIVEVDTHRSSLITHHSYDLTGRKANARQKGVYIVGGKKMVR